MHADGGGLWLQVSNGRHGLNRSWVFRFKSNAGAERYMGLGSVHTVSLAEAREKALQARKLRLEGIDPIEHRDAQRTALKLEQTKALTFKQCAESYIRAHRAGWRSPKHAVEWDATLTKFVYPLVGELPVQAIDTALVIKTLEPIWTTIPDTANRIRVRIERILDSAKARGFRDGENPARWKGHIKNLLPAVAKVRPAGNHTALPYSEIPAFMAALRAEPGTASRVLQFVILTAARSGEALGARWEEIDLEARLWTIPAPRMKSGKEHRVPLAEAACELLRHQAKVRENDHVFPGRTRAQHSNVGLHHLLERLGRDVTIHGFRSTFRDWAAEQTTFPREIAEKALAHIVGDETERAYQRGDLLEKRRALMDAWAEYCSG